MCVCVCSSFLLIEINIGFLCLQICDFGLARLEEPHESAIMTQEVSSFPIHTCAHMILINELSIVDSVISLS